ncbi:unnamed protein product [Rotaria socialis]|uniref:Uncharacterized protein n=1 Tax=Rotaria socialis TaxID=392032 RepID=A0A818DBW4_9BILA|nr:unnamed protein product [Rotaria socialis]CAF4619134.1 unnamed protein product [Rotaria socialis]
MGGKPPTSTISESTVSGTSGRPVPLRAMPSRRRMAQNYLVIWVDGNITENTEDCRNTLAHLRAVVSEAFIISSGALGQRLVSNIHGTTQVDAIYMFFGNKEYHESWTKEWPKIRGVFTSIKPICESFKKVTRECDHDSIPMSFVPKQMITEGATGLDQNNLDQLPPSYMYSVIFQDILLEIDDDDAKSMKALVNFCHQQNIPEKEINEFKRNYHQESPVMWYTKVLYDMFNRGLRLLDMEAMAKLGFFIRSLHLQLKEFHQEQSANFQKALIIYRGQWLSQQDFQSLMHSKGELLSFNNFLSTSKKKGVATAFADGVQKRHQDTVGAIFIMAIDPSKISTSITPFAMIDELSSLSQKIVFTMHTVFRVIEIK